MNHQLQQFITRVINATMLRGRMRDQISKELYSHIVEEERELQLQGFSEEKIYSTITERFGNLEKIARELSMVNTTLTKKQMIGYGILLWFIVSFTFNLIGFLPRCFTSATECSLVMIGLPFISFTTILGAIFFVFLPFSWLYIGLIVSLFLMLRLVLSWSILKKFREGLTSWSAAWWIVAQAAILQWTSIFLSVRSVPHHVNNFHEPIERAGFPFKIFDLPQPPMGNDQPPFEMWGRFYMSYGIWLVVSLILFSLIPTRFKHYPRVSLLVTALGGVISLYGLVWLFLKFD